MTEPPEMTVDDALAWLGALAGRRRDRLRGTVAIAVAAHGRWLVDARAEDVLAPGWDDAADAAILVNARALIDLARGRLDPAAPSADQLCAWTGAPAALVALADAIDARGETKAWATRLKR